MKVQFKPTSKDPVADRELCAVVGCRNQTEIRYLIGATELNPDRDIGLCWKDHAKFCDELDKFRNGEIE